MSDAVVTALMNNPNITEAQAKCLTPMGLYQSSTATVAEAREYARCVQLANPDPMPASVILILKFVVVFAFASGVLGAYRMRDTGYWADIAFGFLGGLSFSLLLVGALAAAAFVLSL